MPPRQLCLAPIALFILTLLCVSSCGPWRKVQDSWEPQIGPQEIRTDAPVFLSDPHISIFPANAPPGPLTAILFPLQVTQPVDNPLILGRALGRIFWRTWSQSQVFPTLVFEEDTTWPGLGKALSLGRARGVDLVIRGEVPYFMSGGSKGTTSISLLVEIYEIEGGQRIWVMEHAGRMEPQPRRDFIVAHHSRRMPEEPAFSIMTRMACDLAEPVGQWNNGRPVEGPCRQQPR